MESIQDKINRFYDPIRDYDESGTNTRYKSWEWCHQAFIQKRIEYLGACDFRKERIIDELALHLACYLASWGMLRSSFLLQRDFKAHKKTVKEILDNKYDCLWDYSPDDNDIITEAKEKLFTGQENDKGLYWKIKEDFYEPDKATDTLVTKILLGTFACVPAYDRFLKDGIAACNGCLPDDEDRLTKSIEDKKGKNFVAISIFVRNHAEELHIDSPQYPPMKCLDMFFWEIGYELGLQKDIEKAQSDLSNAQDKQSPDAKEINKKEKEIQELLNQVKDLYSLPGDLDCKSALSAIKKRNTGSLKRGNA